MFRRRLRASTNAPNPGLESELAALADGALAAPVAEQVRQRVELDPALRDELSAQEDVANVLRQAGVAAPPHLRRRVQEMALQAQAGGRHGRGALHGAGPRALLAFGTALAGVATVLALMLAGPTAPTVVQAAALGLRASTAPAPRAASDRHHLTVSVQGLAFPDWSPGWRAAGVRSDRLGARWARTVQYVDRLGRSVGYVIVAGRPLPDAPGPAPEIGAVRYSARVLAGTVTVSWHQADHTCVLVSRSVPARTLLALAGGEQVPRSYAGWADHTL